MHVFENIQSGFSSFHQTKGYAEPWSLHRKVLGNEVHSIGIQVNVVTCNKCVIPLMVYGASNLLCKYKQRLLLPVKRISLK